MVSQEPCSSSSVLASQRWPIVARDAAIIVALSVALALGYNSLRAQGGVPLIAKEPYQILVPCPELVGKAEALEPAALAPAPGQLVIDARAAEDYASWHLPEALSLPFDYLEPIARPTVEKLLAKQPHQVVVYGDGQHPDSGEQLAKEIAGQGLKNVYFIKGGAPALQAGER